MESSDPRRGPRSTPLVVRRDSNKVKKHPPVSPPPQHQQQQQRPPVIIYTDSPQVIHTSPSEFMSTVQRLTGASSSSTAAARNANSIDDHHRAGPGLVETAAALAPLPDSLVVEMSGSDCFSPSSAADTVNSRSCFISQSQHQFGGCSSSSYADTTNFFASTPNNLLATPGPVVSSSPPPPPPPAADCWDPFNHDQDQII